MACCASPAYGRDKLATQIIDWQAPPTPSNMADHVVPMHMARQGVFVMP